VGNNVLKEYEDKRDFRRTSEPSAGERQAAGEAIFVVQKHDASTLHYDFRLEVDGVLKSWAVPKGPSTNPHDRRLAVPTEDHPMQYADFEGVIPEGEYGGGTVLLWDRVSMSEALAEGRVAVWLEGKKLRGGYALIRTGKGDDNRWLLIKMKDEEADADYDVTAAQPESVLTGRTIEEIAQQ